MGHFGTICAPSYIAPRNPLEAGEFVANLGLSLAVSEGFARARKNGYDGENDKSLPPSYFHGCAAGIRRGADNSVGAGGRTAPRRNEVEYPTAKHRPRAA